ELDELLADLPGIDLYKLPDASLDRGRRGGSGIPPLPWMMAPGRMSPAWRAALGSWVSVSLIAFFVWLLAGHPDNLWFLWIAGPSGPPPGGRGGRGPGAPPPPPPPPRLRPGGGPAGHGRPAGRTPGRRSVREYLGLRRSSHRQLMSRR